MYVKENRQSIAQKDPPLGVSPISKQALVVHPVREWTLKGLEYVVEYRKKGGVKDAAISCNADR